MNPIIIVCGMPQSHTSVITRFLADNGAVLYHPVRTEPMPEPYGYAGYESKELEEYVKQRWIGNHPDLTGFFAGIPDEIVVLKYPTICFFLDEIQLFTDRHLKIVFCLRNPMDNITSSTEKNNWNVERNLLKYRYVWDMMVKTNCLPVITEKVLSKDNKYCEMLLWDCMLWPNPEEINTHVNYSSIDYKPRNSTYFKYRVDNALMKFILKLSGSPVLSVVLRLWIYTTSNLKAWEGVSQRM